MTTFFFFWSLIQEVECIVRYAYLALQRTKKQERDRIVLEWLARWEALQTGQSLCPFSAFTSAGLEISLLGIMIVCLHSSNE